MRGPSATGKVAVRETDLNVLVDEVGFRLDRNEFVAIDTLSRMASRKTKGTEKKPHRVTFVRQRCQRRLRGDEQGDRQDPQVRAVPTRAALPRCAEADDRISGTRLFS